MLAVVAPVTAAAQAPTGPALAAPAAPAALTVRADNDAFNFWVEPGARPDREFTSGVHLIYEGGLAPWWGGWVARGTPACTGAEVCRARVLEIGQLIFTPERSRHALTPPPGSRPNGGWLFVRDGARLQRPHRRDEVALTLGVTGRPALGAEMQRLFHGFAPTFNRPIDWSEQVAFVPGVQLAFEHTRSLGARRNVGIGIDAQPRINLTAGNVFTHAEAGVRVRGGWNVQHPWMPARQAPAVELALTGGGSVRAVARNALLDGYVSREPVVYRAEWELMGRYRALFASYGAVTETRGYRTAPARHTWSSLAAGLRFWR